MADPVRVRRLTDHEGRRLQQIVRRGTGSAVRLRRAMVVLASAGGNTVPAIARLVQGVEDAVREMIHRFNEMGMRSWTLSGRVAVPARSRLTTRRSSSRRPRLDPRHSVSPSPAGGSASSPPPRDRTRSA